MLYSVKQKFRKVSSGCQGWVLVFCRTGYDYKPTKNIFLGLNANVSYLMAISKISEIGVKVKMNYNGINPFLGIGLTINVW
ncbi:hypothetical protein FHR24_000143 [Wenyingzhuangia heitensis]|uniref:Uncharacterized protein n=1 Tax=Wenyingzhuangia heitensis TaxID=1487859 RepID=A0ABX0U5R7_9FLAO|nr:hypothetical protein [Wenyingzhuangia heitensis]